MPTRPSQHRAPGWHPYKEPAKQVRLRQARHELPTNSTAWRRLREAHLSREPLCRECAKKDRVRAATHVDHIDGEPRRPDRSSSDCMRALQSVAGGSDAT